MKVSVIAAVYKDIDALKLIVEALKTQTYKDFELVVAEDNDAAAMKAYVDSITEIEVAHTSQEDVTIRKSRSQNNAIIKSSGEYLIFIDGDCVPYSTFIEGHVTLAQEKVVISGRRVNLGPQYAAKLRKHTLSPLDLEKSFVWRFPMIVLDADEGHTETGFTVPPDGWIYNTFLRDRKASTTLLGCNFSCYKKDMLAINGFNEEYGPSPLSDDTDLQWRFAGMGLEMKSCKNVANVFHLHHDRTFRTGIKQENDPFESFRKNQEAKRYVCEQGLSTH